LKITATTEEWGYRHKGDDVWLIGYLPVTGAESANSLLEDSVSNWQIKAPRRLARLLV
jgi:hypothetical protein